MAIDKHALWQVQDPHLKSISANYHQTTSLKVHWREGKCHRVLQIVGDIHGFQLVSIVAS